MHRLLPVFLLCRASTGPVIADLLPDAANTAADNTAATNTSDDMLLLLLLLSRTWASASLPSAAPDAAREPTLQMSKCKHACKC
jgi:hypothetical protein